MKTIFFAFMTVLSITASCNADFSTHIPPKITIQSNGEAVIEDRPIVLTVIIDHSASDTVQIKSFKIDKQPITVEFIREEKISPEGLPEDPQAEAFLVSRYRAILPQKQQGIYTVGPIHVSIGNIEYTSNSLVLQVQATETSNQFRLTANIEAPSTIFPGQIVTFEYQIFFKDSMQLLKEDLPLLNVPGFVTIGAPEITTEKADQGYIQKIRQAARATTPGTMTTGQSTIEGMIVDTSSETPRLMPPLYQAKAPSIDVVVDAFPQEGKPSSFTGALGAFTWRVTPPGGTVRAGERVRIEYRVSGRGDLATVRFPDYTQIRGLQDNFWTEGPPPVGEEVDGTKRFDLFIHPKNPGNQEVPGFFVSSFDPIEQQYQTATVTPVKLSVEKASEEHGEESQSTFSAVDQSPVPFGLTKLVSYSKEVPFMWIVLAFFGVLILGAIQWYVARAIRARKAKKTETSRDLFYKAIMARSKREKGLLLLKQALYVRLYELRLTPTRVDSPADVVGEGITAEARTLLQTIDRCLYREPGETTSLQEVYDEASQLYYRLKQLGPS